MALRSHETSLAGNPRSSDFFCVIEQSDDEQGAGEPDSRKAAPNAAVVSLVWGTTVVAMRTFTRSKRVSVADLGVMEDSIGPSFAIKASHRGMTIHTPHGDAVPRGFRMRMLCCDGTTNVSASRRATSLTLVCEAVTLSPDRLAGVLPDARGRALGTLAVAFFPLMLSIFRVGAPDPRAPDDPEAQKDRLAFVQTALAAADKREERSHAVQDDGENAGVSRARGGTGGSSSGEEGSQGDTSSRNEDGLTRAEQRKSAPPSTKEVAEEARTFGMISLLDGSDTKARPTSAFAAFDIDAANGGLRGDIFKDAFGMGSDGLSGVGEGGGGLGAGVGITQLGTLGNGVASTEKDGSTGGYGFGKGGGHARLAGSHRSSMMFSDGGGGYQVNGRLPPESIQRVVRSNFGRLRGCYEEALLRNPQLEGRVSVKFVIDRSGAVSTAELAETTLDDAKVTACVVAHYKQMSFPEPEGGIVTVVYPVIFSSG